MMSKPNEEFRQMLSEDQVLARVPFSRSTLRKLVKTGDFPKPRRISGNRVAWLLDDLRQWQSNLPDEPIRDGRGSRARRMGGKPRPRRGVTPPSAG